MAVSASAVRLTVPNGKVLQDLFDGGYDVTVRSADLITKGPWVDVRAHGATGDGVTDETTLVQAGVTAVAGTDKCLYIPPGLTFLVSTLTGADVRICGEGTIKQITTTNAPMLTLSGTSYLSGGPGGPLILDGDQANGSVSYPYSKALVYVPGVADTLYAERVHFSNPYWRAITNGGGSLEVRKSRFTGSKLHDGAGSGTALIPHYIACIPGAVTLADDARVIVEDSYFKGSTTDTDEYGRNPTGVIVTHSSTGSQYKLLRVTGNEFWYTGLNWGAPGYENETAPVDTYDGVDRAIITDNLIYGYSYAGLKIQNSNSITIANNQILNGFSSTSCAVPSQAYGIILNDKVRGESTELDRATVVGNIIDGFQYAGIYSGLDNVQFIGNVLKNGTTPGGGTTKAYWIYEGARISILGGSIEAVEHHNIYLGSTTERVIVSGVSMFYDGAAPMYILGSNHNISGNTLKKNGTASSTGIRTDGPLSNTYIGGNVLENMAIGVDLRETGGDLSNVTVGPNVYKDVTTHISTTDTDGQVVVLPYRTLVYQIQTGAKVGATAGWSVNDGTNRGGLAKLPAEQSGSTLVVPLTGLPVGYTITGYTVRGQVESAGNTATLDAALRSLTVATADLTDAAVTDGAITQVSVTADAQIASAVTGLSSVITAGKTFYLLITGTTAASTDFDLSSIDVTVRP